MFSRRNFERGKFCIGGDLFRQEKKLAILEKVIGENDSVHGKCSFTRMLQNPDVAF